MSDPLASFKTYIPRTVRIGLFISFSILFQCANVTYLSLLGDITGANQFYKEDLSFAYQVSSIGVTFVFPLLFRLKFRFTSQQILITCTLVLITLLGISVSTQSVPVLILCAFGVGVAKMVGTFESLVSIQLIITPQKDYGMFFSVALGIVLLSGQLSASLAIYLADLYDWRMIYGLEILALALQLLFLGSFMRPYRLSRKLPLYGIDWQGFIHWSIWFSLISYVAIYGQVLDWFASKKIVMATCGICIWGILVIIRTKTARRALILAKVFQLSGVNTAILVMLAAQFFINTTGSVLGPFTTLILHLDNLHVGALNGWIAAGILVGAVFSYAWFYRINGNFRWIFGLGFLGLTLHHAILFFDLSAYANEQVLFLPYFLKGLGTMVIYASTAKYMTRGVDVAIFPQVLCYMAMCRNALSGVLAGSIITNTMYTWSQDYLHKLASRMDRVYTSSLGSSLQHQRFQTMEDLQRTAMALQGRVNRQAILLAGRDMFGWASVLGLVVLLIILLYHFTAPFVKRIPSWAERYASIKRREL